MASKPIFAYRPAPSIAVAAYLFYMFRHHRTRFSVHHPLESAMQDRVGDFFKHPISTNARYGLQICPFGRQGILALVAFLLARAWAVHKSIATPQHVRRVSAFALATTGTLSLMNMNAVLYLAPYFAMEALALRC